MSWYERAICRGADNRVWFPIKGESAQYARSACKDCPVQLECLNAGLNEKYGVWGATTEKQRRKLKVSA